MNNCDMCDKPATHQLSTFYKVISLTSKKANKQLVYITIGDDNDMEMCQSCIDKYTTTSKQTTTL